jgi:hypothetical protein
LRSSAVLDPIAQPAGEFGQVEIGAYVGIARRGVIIKMDLAKP